MTRSSPDTDVNCECNVTENFAADPESPIIFDSKTNEFHLKWGKDHARTNILYYCSFCGGKLPKSIRDGLFARVTDSEMVRLQQLTEKIETIEDAIQTLGTPDHDLRNGNSDKTKFKPDEPQIVNTYRALLYSDYSETADIRITVYPNQNVQIQFIGKYIGERS